MCCRPRYGGATYLYVPRRAESIAAVGHRLIAESLFTNESPIIPSDRGETKLRGIGTYFKAIGDSSRPVPGKALADFLGSSARILPERNLDRCMRSIRPFDLDTRACFRFQVGQGCGKRLWRVRRLVIYGNDEVVGTNPGTICMSERRVILRHALRSALTPVVTQFGIDLATLLGGAIVTENVFGLPGLG